MEGFLTRGWDPIVPGCLYLHESQPISDHGGGFSKPCGAVSTRGIAVGVVDVVVWMNFCSGDGTLSSPGVFESLRQSVGSLWGWVFSTPCGAVSTRGIAVSSPVGRSCGDVQGFLIR